MYSVAVGDIVAYHGNCGKAMAEYPEARRVDLNMDGAITAGGDALMYRGMIGETCT